MTHFAGRAGKVLFLSVLTAMLLAATALAADIATGAGCTTGSSLRLRAEPSTSASVVTTLDKSVAVAILDDSVDGWYKIAYNGSTGYVSADYLNVDQDNVFTTYGRVNSDGRERPLRRLYRQLCAGPPLRRTPSSRSTAWWTAGTTSPVSTAPRVTSAATSWT